jgi:hypothetical protein
MIRVESRVNRDAAASTEPDLNRLGVARVKGVASGSIVMLSRAVLCGCASETT